MNPVISSTTAAFEIVQRGTLDALIAENQNLRLQLNTSQTTITTLNLTIDNLREENRRLREELQVMRDDISELKQKIEQAETKSIVSKFIVALQDLNRADQLERKIPELTKLRKRRNAENHYIYEDDDTEAEVAEKKYILRRALAKLPSNIVQELERVVKIPGLVGKLRPLVKHYHSVPVNADVIEEMVEYFSPILTVDDI